MAGTFNCPACGAPLETDGRETSIHCEYCGESVIVPQELRVATQPIPGAGHIPMGSEQPAGGANFPAQLTPTQVRQMMQAIRSGQLEEAATLFLTGTGVDQAAARQTVDTIAGQLANSNRILPAELATLMMGAFSQQAQGYNQPYQPVPTPRRRRRGSGLGCLLTLVIILLVIYFSYVSLSPTQLVGGITSGDPNNPVRQTAMAPISKISTAVAPVIGGLFSQNTNK